MIENRSAPVDTVLPHLSYPDVKEAIASLQRLFGFAEHFRYGLEDGDCSGAQIYLGRAIIMLKRSRSEAGTAREAGCGALSLTVFLEDVEEHYRRSVAAGARILEEPHETEYGEFQYSAADHAGHRWLFSRHARDRDPAEWGAAVHEPPLNRLAARPRPSFCYVQIPALNAKVSARFYQAVFGWGIRDADSSNPRFDDASGNISGAWVTGRAIASTPGMLPYVWVDGIYNVLERAVAQGGKVVDPPHPDHPGGSCLIATMLDVAGNLLGVYEENVSVQPDHHLHQKEPAEVKR